MSALGQKQTCAAQQRMSALPPKATTKADFPKNHVRFTPKSGHHVANHYPSYCDAGAARWQP